MMHQPGELPRMRHALQQQSEDMLATASRAGTSAPVDSGLVAPAAAPPQGDDTAERVEVRTPLRIPLWLVLLWTMLTFDAALGVAFMPLISVIGLALLVIVAVGFWAYRYAGPLAAALTLLVLSLPFTFTATRFDISPQEVLLYGIWLVAALFNPGGTRHWLIQVLTSMSPLVRFAVLLFAIAATQATVHLTPFSLVMLSTSLRHAVVFPVLLAFLVAYAVRTRRCEALLLLAFAAGAALFAVYALALRVLGVAVGIGATAGRLGSEASSLSQYAPNNLGLYLVLGLAFVPSIIRQALRSRTWSDIWLAAASSVATLVVIALWLTYSRGALLALVGVVGVLVLGAVFLVSRRQRAIILGLAGTAIALGAILLATGARFLGRYGQLVSPNALLNDPNVQFRIQLYQRAWALIQTHPLTGVGLGGFSVGSNVPFSPHDTYLDLLVGTGLFGAAGVVLVMVIGVVVAWRAFLRLRAVARGNGLYLLGVAAALVGFLIQALTEAFTGNPRIFPAAWFLVACAEGTILALLPRGHAATASADQGNTTIGDTRHPAPVPVAPELPADLRRGAEHTSIVEPLPGANEQLNPGPTSSALASPKKLEDVIDALFDSSGELIAIRPWHIKRNTERAITDHDSNAPTGLERERAVSQELLRRAPTSYLWNQAYTLWYFIMNFLLSIVIARQLSQQEYGIFAVLLTLLTSLQFLCTFGLEDMVVVFLPRLLSSGGRGLAGALVRRVLLIRVQVLLIVAALILVGLFPALALLARLGISVDTRLLGEPHGLSVRVICMAAYFVGMGVVSVETALFASVLRSRVTLVVGGISQAFNVVLAALILSHGGGIDGLFALLAGVAWLTALAYLLPLRGLLLTRRRRTLREGKDISRLMMSAWLVNIANGALGKQSDILLMGVFAVGYAAIGNYNLAYQLANILGVLLVAGLGGVGPAAMSAAFSAGGPQRLAEVWRATVMFQVLVTIPLLTFSVIEAGPLITTLYSNRYGGAVPLLQLFLVATIAMRLVGGGVHQSALYVLGRQRLVLAIRWIGLVVNIGLDLGLIPLYGPYGALIATSATQLVVGGIEHLFVRRFLPVRYPLAFAGQVVGATTMALVALLTLAPHNFITLALSFGAFLIALLVGLLVLGLSSGEHFRRILELRPGMLAAWTRLRNQLLGGQLPEPAPASDGLPQG